MLPGYLTKKQLAERLGVHVNTITNDIRRGRLKPETLKPKTYISESNAYVTARLSKLKNN